MNVFGEQDTHPAGGNDPACTGVAGGAELLAMLPSQDGAGSE